MAIFDTDIAVEPKGDGLYKGHISRNWSVNGTSNGGYLMALMARAMVMDSDRTATPIVTANYLARCQTGPATVEVEKFSVTTQFSRFQARLLQDDSERVRAFGTFADENIACALERTETGPPASAPLQDCIVVPALPDYDLFQNLEVRLDPAFAGWMVENRPSPTSETRGWIKFRDDQAWDLFRLLLAADAFPPAVLSSQGMVAWVPTIELSVNLRRSPQSQWLRGFFRTRFITCNLLEEDGELWDTSGNLVAISRQIAQYRPAKG